jgi:eukaryotic-like serine/threonine-protein kinase
MSSTSVLLGGRYRLDSRIAAGGGGEVWRGRDIVLARPVAVKLLLAEHAAQPQTVARFRDEARHAGRVSHPAVAHVYDYGDAQPPHPAFLVMELVDGPSLAGVLSSGPLDPARAMDVVAQTAAGLHAAHLAGLVHSDVKPGNLLLSHGTDVKITDFGIAHATGSPQADSTGAVVGTPAYLAPERVAGAPATTASDMYSLGIVAYECLAGAPPFRGTAEEMTAAHSERTVPPLPATVPPGMAALVAELTGKDPATRPSASEAERHASQLRDTYRAASGATMRLGSWPDQPPATLAGSPTPGAWPRRGRRLGGVRLTRRSAVLAAAAVITAGLAGLTLHGLGAAPLPGAQPSGTPRPGPSAAASLFNVNRDALIGQPVTAVRQQLTQLGLVVRVNWRPSGKQPPGAVVAVQPAGWLPPGSVVTLTGALAPKDHGHGNGGGDGR